MPETTAIKKPIQGKKLAWLLTLLYFASYITRRTFSTVISEVVLDTGIDKDTLAIVAVCMTITYGVGQIISGRLGDKFKPTNLILIGLSIATAANVIFPFLSGSVVAMAILWGINGFAQSMMWPPIVRILVANCDDALYGYSVVRVSWGSSFAKILLFLAAPLVILVTGSWTSLFFVAAVLGLLTTVFWGLIRSRVNCNVPTADGSTSDAPKKEKLRVPAAAILPLIFIILGIIFQGMLRDGVDIWMPSFLIDVHSAESAVAILTGVFPAVFSIACFTVCGFLYKKCFKNEVVCGGVVFAVSVVASAVLLIFFGKSTVLSIVAMTLITGCMHGVNLMLITHVPKRFKKHGNISTFAGVVNACTYVGEAIFTYGIALLQKQFDWRFCIGIILIIAVLGTVCCFIAAAPWKRFYEKD